MKMKMGMIRMTGIKELMLRADKKDNQLNRDVWTDAGGAGFALYWQGVIEYLHLENDPERIQEPLIY